MRALDVFVGRVERLDGLCRRSADSGGELTTVRAEAERLHKALEALTAGVPRDPRRERAMLASERRIAAARSALLARATYTWQ
jgi:hypothetical protein